MNLDPSSTVSGAFSGFLGTRASWTLDFVALAMVLLIPILFWSVFLVRVRRHYTWHKRIQLIAATVLTVTIGLFEYDMRFVTDWRKLAAVSPYWNVQGINVLSWALTIHLAVAIPTFLLWVGVIVGALCGFSRPPKPGRHSRWHRPLGWLSVVGMCMTAVTGWIFYWMAFVA